ncbi:MAG: tubulin-like doman-containing protein [Paludibacteraceae bacterium]
MRTKLRKTFYIGLGGTGMNAILRTKKMFIDNYNGQVPPMIGFLGIDTDGGVYDKKLEAKDGSVVQLEPFEQCSISVRNPIDYYSTNHRRLSWLPENNVGMIRNLDKGAGQVRTNGRLALINNLTYVRNAISNVYAQISSNTIIDNPTYELLPDNVVDVHVVFSVCGGTGCGTFIDLAYLLKSMYNSGTRGVNVCGYGVLPNVFHEMNKVGNAMAKTKPNAYGAIQDLDFLMHMGPDKKPVSFDWMSSDYNANVPPFDAFFFVDNKNDNNILYGHVDNLAEMISLALVSAAGQIGTETASITNNVEKCMIEGDLDVENKKAWASCIGASQIVFRGEELSKVYGLLVQQRIIQRILNACESGDAEANRWIDLPEVNIRENNNQDNVINYLCSTTVKDFDIDDNEVSQPENVVEDFSKRTLEVANRTAQKNMQGLLENVSAQLTKEVQELLSRGDCGVTLAIDTLLGITRQINLFIEEMTHEKEELEDSICGLDNKKKAAIEELKRFANKFFKTKSKMQERIDDVKQMTQKMVRTNIEIIRRTYAIQFFNGLLAKIETEYSRVNNIKLLLQKQAEEISQELIRRRNQGTTQNTVEVDLSEESWDLIKVSDDTVVISDFIKALPSKELYYLSDSAELKSAFEQYVEQLPIYKQWKEKTIDDVINEKTDEQFQQIVKRAMDKAMPFMKINGHGKLTTRGQKEIQQSINRYYFVCLPDSKKSRFTLNDNFKKMNDSTLNVSFVSTGLEDRIIIYRQDGTIPAFAIDGVELFAEDSGRSGVDFHFDFNIEQRMKDEHYQLMPKESSEDAMALWVNGFIFGLIKYDDQKRTYFYYDEDNGDPLDDFWYNTGEHYRDTAFNFFDRHLKTIQDSFEEKIDEKIHKMGDDAYRKLLMDVRENYIKKYAQVPIQVGKTNTRNQTPVKELLAQEVIYVTKELGK